MRGRKSGSIIVTDDVPSIFGDCCMRRLAAIAKLPASADLDAFAKGIREAASIYVREGREPTDNELHREITELHRAATATRYDQVATLIESLSPKALAVLSRRAAFELPSPAEVRDARQRAKACATVTSVCAFGGAQVEGRKRSSGKRSITWRPLLYAPQPRRNFRRRDAERNFVMWLRIAWLDATGVEASRTARHSGPGRDVGPFARFVRECLRLVGAGHCDVVELLNELNHRRPIKNRAG
jgi:hypothetical protein